MGAYSRLVTTVLGDLPPLARFVVVGAVCLCVVGGIVGLIVGLFAVVYAMARSFCEFFREPDPQLGFLWGGLTMGMLLSVPLFLAGIAFVVNALRRPALTSKAA